MNSQHSDRLIILWSVAGSVVIAVVVGVFVVLAWLERRRDRVREAEAATVGLRPVSTVQERSVEAIAADGMTDAERADAERDARLAAYLKFDFRAELRTATIELQADLIAVERRACEGAELSADAIARYMGHRDGVVGLRAALLIDQCHNDRAELVDLVNTTCEWPPEWETELVDLLREGAPA